MIHPELPQPYNSGYLMTFGDQVVYHPGDALALPEVPVDVLLCPSSAPWLRSEMAIEFVRAVGAPRNLAIHDRVYSEVGHGFLATQMETLVGPRGQEWLRRADGADLDAGPGPYSPSDTGGTGMTQDPTQAGLSLDPWMAAYYAAP